MYRPGGRSGPQDIHEHLQEIQSRNRALREQQQQRQQLKDEAAKSKPKPKNATKKTGEDGGVQPNGFITNTKDINRVPSASQIPTNGINTEHPTVNRNSRSLHSVSVSTVLPSSRIPTKSQSKGLILQTDTPTALLNQSLLSPSHNDEHIPTWLHEMEHQPHRNQTTTTTTKTKKHPSTTDIPTVVTNASFPPSSSTTVTTLTNKKTKTHWKDFGSTIVIAAADGRQVRLPKPPMEDKDDDDDDESRKDNKRNNTAGNTENVDTQYDHPYPNDVPKTVPSPPSYQSQIRKIREKARQQYNQVSSSSSSSSSVLPTIEYTKPVPTTRTNISSDKSTTPPSQIMQHDTTTIPPTNSFDTNTTDLLSFMASIAPNTETNISSSPKISNYIVSPSRHHPQSTVKGKPSRKGNHTVTSVSPAIVSPRSPIPSSLPASSTPSKNSNINRNSEVSPRPLPSPDHSQATNTAAWDTKKPSVARYTNSNVTSTVPSPAKLSMDESRIPPPPPPSSVPTGLSPVSPNNTTLHLPSPIHGKEGLSPNITRIQSTTTDTLTVPSPYGTKYPVPLPLTMDDTRGIHDTTTLPMTYADDTVTFIEENKNTNDRNNPLRSSWMPLKFTSQPTLSSSATTAATSTVSSIPPPPTTTITKKPLMMDIQDMVHDENEEEDEEDNQNDTRSDSFNDDSPHNANRSAVSSLHPSATDTTFGPDLTLLRSFRPVPIDDIFIPSSPHPPSYSPNGSTNNTFLFPRLPTPPIVGNDGSIQLTIDPNEDYVHPFTTPSKSLIHQRSPRLPSSVPSMTTDTTMDYFPLHNPPLSSSVPVMTTTVSSPTYPSSSSSTTTATTGNNTNPLSPNGPTVPYFSIPELPTGAGLQIELLSTWGDIHYVGLNGIEIFTADGKLLTFTSTGTNPNVYALPYNDINAILVPDTVSPTVKDPRTLDKLFDGINVTCDDTHSWLIPWSPVPSTTTPATDTVPPPSSSSSFPTLYLTFDEPNVTLAMIRIFNYNKSRIHSYRGVRHVRIRMVTWAADTQSSWSEAHVHPLSSDLIFDGEIKKAPGRSTTIFHECCETILFTTDSTILGRIEQYDPHASLLKEEIYRQYHHLQEKDELPNVIEQYIQLAALVDRQRPPTAETINDTTLVMNSSLTSPLPSSSKRKSVPVNARTVSSLSTAKPVKTLLRHTRSRKPKDFVPYHQLTDAEKKEEEEEQGETPYSPSVLPPPPPPPSLPRTTLGTDTNGNTAEEEEEEDYDTGKNSFTPPHRLVSPKVRTHGSSPVINEEDEEEEEEEGQDDDNGDDSFDSFDSSRSFDDDANEGSPHRHDPPSFVRKGTVPTHARLTSDVNDDDLQQLMNEFRITTAPVSVVPPPPVHSPSISSSAVPTTSKGKTLLPSSSPSPLLSSSSSSSSTLYADEFSTPLIDSEVSLQNLPRGRLLTMKLLSTYGDTHYVGLTGIEIYYAEPLSPSSSKGRIRLLTLSPQQIYAQPRDLNTVLIDEEIARIKEELFHQHYSNEYVEDYIQNFRQSLTVLPPRDPRTLDKLVNNDNLTTDDTSMWLIPWTSRNTTGPTMMNNDGERTEPLPTRYTKDIHQHVVQIDCLRSLYISGIKIYNYNKSGEDSFRGVQHCLMTLDHQPLYLPPFVTSSTTSSLRVDDLYPIIPLRKAPGTVDYDYGQYLRLSTHRFVHPDSVSTVIMVNDFHHHLPSSFPSSSSTDRSYRSPRRTIHLPSSRTLSALLLPLYPALPLKSKTKGLSSSSSSLSVVFPPQDTFEPILHPCGYEYKFIFDSNCGDMYYLGIDCIALYDTNGYRIPVLPHQITAYPSSINDLLPTTTGKESTMKDSRLPSNFRFLSDTINYHDSFGPHQSDGSGNSTEDHSVPNECILRHDDPLLYYPVPSTRLLSSVPLPSSPYPPSRAWLSPLYAPRADHPERIGNTVTFHFSSPVSISMVRIFNYSKNPSRGAGRVQLWLDSLCIFQGDLQPAPELLTPKPLSTMGATVNSVTSQYIPRPCCTLAFTQNSLLLQRDIDLKYIHYCGTTDQDIAYYNDGKLISKLSVKAQYAFNAALEAARRPSQRPFTAIGMNQ